MNRTSEDGSAILDWIRANWLILGVLTSVVLIAAIALMSTPTESASRTFANIVSPMIGLYAIVLLNQRTLFMETRLNLDRQEDKQKTFQKAAELLSQNTFVGREAGLILIEQLCISEDVYRPMAMKLIAGTVRDISKDRHDEFTYNGDNLSDHARRGTTETVGVLRAFMATNELHFGAAQGGGGIAIMNLCLVKAFIENNGLRRTYLFNFVGCDCTFNEVHFNGATIAPKYWKDLEFRKCAMPDIILKTASMCQNEIVFADCVLTNAEIAMKSGKLRFENCKIDGASFWAPDIVFEGCTFVESPPKIMMDVKQKKKSSRNHVHFC